MTDTPTPAKRDLLAWTVMLFCGLSWGMTGPLSKLAVSTGNHPVGITFWGVLISAVVFTAVLIIRRERPPLDWRHILFFLGCGFLGTAFPNSLSYEAYKHLPVGINVMILSLIPMMTLMIALPLGVERLDPRRVLGLGLGVAAVALITLPDTSLPVAGQAVLVLLPLAVSLSYAGENVFIAHSQPPGISTWVVMWGLSVGGLALIAPVAFGLGAVFDITRFGPAEQAVLGSYTLHVFAYFGFVWLIARAGPVFASLVGYVVTGVGVVLGMAIYDERHSVWVWAALAVMMVGLSLVKPKSEER